MTDALLESPDTGRPGPSTAVSILLLTGLCAALFLPALASMPLVDPDEARCAAVVQDMFRTGRWLMPHLEGAIYWDKPAPFFWMAAGMQKLTGSVELGGRLVAALAAWSAVLITFSLVRRIAGPRAGLIAGVILATSVMFLHLARWYRMDMPLAAGVLAAIWWWWRFESPLRRKSHWQWVGFYAFGALAVLFKGPAGLAIPVAVVFVFLLLSRQWRRLPEFFNFWGLIVLVALAVPWYLAAGLRYPLYFEKFFVEQNVSRFTSKTFGDRTLYGVGYIPILIGGMIPWSMYLVPAVRHIWPGRVDGKRAPFDRGHLLLATAVLVPLMFFMISKTQMPPYILPILAPMAGLLALPLAKWVGDAQADRWMRLGNVFAMTSLALLAATLCGLEIYLRWADAWMAAPIAAVVLALAAMVFAMRRARPAKFLAATTAGLIVVLAFGAGHAQPRGYEEMSLRSLARMLPPADAGSPPKLCCWSDVRHSLTVYSGAPYTVRFEHWSGGLETLTRYLMQENSYCLWSEPESDLSALEKSAARHGMRVVTIGRKHRFILLKLQPLPTPTSTST